MSRKDSDTFSSQDIPQPHCLITGTRGNVVTIWMKLDNLHTHIYKDSQKIKIKKKTKTPRITDEGWNSQKQPSDSDERKEKKIEKTPVSSSKALFRFSSLKAFLQNRHSM